MKEGLLRASLSRVSKNSEREVVGGVTRLPSPPAFPSPSPCHPPAIPLASPHYHSRSHRPSLETPRKFERRPSSYLTFRLLSPLWAKPLQNIHNFLTLRSLAGLSFLFYNTDRNYNLNDNVRVAPGSFAKR